MGAGALLALSALIGGASLAVSALNSVPTPQNTTDTSSATNNNNISVNVSTDKFGTVSDIVDSSSNNNNSIQTNFGSGS